MLSLLEPSENMVPYVGRFENVSGKIGTKAGKSCMYEGKGSNHSVDVTKMNDHKKAT